MNEKKAILIVDDHEALRESLKDILMFKGFNVHGVPSGFDALQKCNDHLFDLVIMDVRMPGISGVETIRQIKELLSYCPKFIVMSAFVIEELKEEAFRLGVVDFFSKPLQVPLLLESIEKVFSSGRRLA